MNYEGTQIIMAGLLIGLVLACLALIALIMRLRSLKGQLFKKSDELTRERQERQCVQRQFSEQCKHLDSLLCDSKKYAIYRVFADQETGQIKVIFVSPSLCEIIGMPENELNDFDKWLDYIHEDDLERVEKRLKTKLQRPFEVDFKFRVINPKKGVRWVCARVSGLALEEDTKAIGFSNGLIIDITEKRVIYERLEKSEERLKAIFEKSLNAILVADDEGNYIDVNPAACELLGYSRQELLTMNVRDIKRKNQHMTYEQYARYLKSRYDKGEFDFIHKSGREMVADYKAFHVRKDFNVSFMSDISERVYYEQQLQESIKAAQEANKAKSMFLANMSHEIRTPMNGVIGFADILLKSQPTEKQKEYISYISSSAKKLLAIINDIFDFSKIEADSMTLEKKPMNLSQLAKTMTQLVQTASHKAGIVIKADIDEAIPKMLLGDELRLSQILTNLMSNALKFTQKGHVKLSIETLSEDENACRMRFCVSDTGIGMEEATLGQIAHAFKQADSTISRIYGGTGLGLYITQKLLGLMGSSLEIKSELGEGSSFSFDLIMEKGLEQDENPTEESQVKTCTQIESEMKVLIVEDNHINRILARTLVSKNIQNATIFECDTGKRAIECYVNHNPDLILMDIHMPDMNGIDATRSIRQIEGSLKQTIIIGLTADIKPEKHKEAIENGMNEVLTKPFESETFLCLLKSHLGVEKSE